GTEILLDPDVVLIIKEIVNAIGTPDQIITFAPMNNETKWGSIILDPPSGLKSTFSYTKFIGGGSKMDFNAMLFNRYSLLIVENSYFGNRWNVFHSQFTNLK